MSAGDAIRVGRDEDAGEVGKARRDGRLSGLAEDAAVESGALGAWVWKALARTLTAVIGEVVPEVPGRG
jgi:hypothetical protein